MGLSHKYNILCHCTFFYLGMFCFLIISSSTKMGFTVEGRSRTLLKQSKVVDEDRSIESEKIGSRPPRCERRCSSCPHCEAIQVPTNPQARQGCNSSSLLSYATGDDYSNYKPMSWKCKCGNAIFNP